MIDGIRLKVCGLTRLADAVAAVGAGADYLGFIFHPGSPRRVTLETFRGLKAGLVGRNLVAVSASPAFADLREQAAAGASFFQVHFDVGTSLEVLGGWSSAVGAENLWLAPRLPPGQDVNPAWLPLAGTILLDTFHPEKFGGTGKTGDWAKFARHQKTHPQKTWVLSGGLNPGNAGEALRQSGARFVDVNSGIENSPGVKDAAHLEAFVVALRQAGPDSRR